MKHILEPHLLSLFSGGLPTFLLLLLLAVVLSIKARAITLSGGVAGAGIALSIYLGAAWLGILLLGLFFVAGSLATRWGETVKASLGLAQEREGQRSAANALANGLAPALLGIMAWWSGGEAPYAYPMLAASLACATSDTLSSEMGNLYGRQYWDLRTFRAGQRGDDGVISLEGTLFGLFGSLLIALPCAIHYGTWQAIWWVGGAGLLGNFADSLLGAGPQRAGWLNNHTVNFWSTLLAAAFAALFYAL